MALTLAEGAKLSNDVLLEGVIETAIADSPVLQRMPFIEIEVAIGASRGCTAGGCRGRPRCDVRKSG